MQAIDDLNTADDISAVLGGMTLSFYLMWHSGSIPEFTDKGTVILGKDEFGLSPKVGAWMLEYEILFDEAKNPKNRTRLKGPTHQGSAALTRCADYVKLDLMISNNVVFDVGWEGDGCTMALSSASLMTQWLRGKTVQQVKEVEERFRLMMLHEGPIDNVPDELIIFMPVRVNPMKVECILVVWDALRKAMYGKESSGSVRS